MHHWAWRVVGGLVAIAVSAAVSLWIHKKQSNKGLTYNVVSLSPLVPLEARGFTDLRLHKGDKPIERPFLTTIRIANNGDLDIQATDFAAPLTIRPIGASLFDSAQINLEKFNSVVKIFDVPYKGTAAFVPQVIDARVAYTIPPKIPVEIDISGAELKVRPLLLNVGDEFTVEMLINGDVRAIEVAGRIAGVKRIQEEINATSRSWWSVLMIYASGFLAGVATYLSYLALRWVIPKIADRKQ